MKIGVVVDNNFENDIRVYKEVSILREHFDVDVLCLINDKDEVLGENIYAIWLPKVLKQWLFALSSWLPLYNWIWTRAIQSFIETKNIDILHAHDLYMASPCKSAIDNVSRSVKLVLDLHENFPVAINSYSWTKGPIRSFLTRPRLWSKKEEYLLRNVDRIITLSSDYKNELLKKYNHLTPENLFDYPNVVDFSRFEKFTVDEDRVRDSRTTFFYFGVVAERRGIFETIECFRNALSKNRNLLLRIIGPVDKADSYRFEQLLVDSQLIKNIEYIPWIPLEEILTELNRVDVCLAPFRNNAQHNSGVANKIFQYMYAGKPIIASNCKPQMELISHAECGVVFNNLDEYTDLIIALASNNEEVIAMGNKGKKYLLQNFNDRKNSKKLLQVYSTFEKIS